MTETTLLTKNVQEILKLQVWLKNSGKYLDALYSKIETDDPAKKDPLFEPLRKAYNAMWDSVDILQRNTEELMGIDQAIEDNKN